MSEHKCAQFTYDKDFGVEIITDPVIYTTLTEMSRAQKAPVIDPNDHDELQEWDRISVHGYEIQEGITSGHVYKFVDDGVLIGDVVITW